MRTNAAASSSAGGFGRVALEPHVDRTRVLAQRERRRGGARGEPACIGDEHIVIAREDERPGQAPEIAEERAHARIVEGEIARVHAARLAQPGQREQRIDTRELGLLRIGAREVEPRAHEQQRVRLRLAPLAKRPIKSERERAARAHAEHDRRRAERRRVERAVGMAHERGDLARAALGREREEREREGDRHAPHQLAEEAPLRVRHLVDEGATVETQHMGERRCIARHERKDDATAEGVPLDVETRGERRARLSLR